MADETSTTTPQGARGGGNREPGGFRIRLSDNEMQAARALQEAFGLRSTVAVLGFALRTLAQQLEAGELEELVARQRAQGGGRPPAPRRERDGERGERGERRERRGPGERAARVDPFARPSRPAPAAAEEENAAVSEDSAEAAAPGDEVSGLADDTGATPEALPDEVAAETSAAADASAS